MSWLVCATSASQRCTKLCVVCGPSQTISTAIIATATSTSASASLNASRPRWSGCARLASGRMGFGSSALSMAGFVLLPRVEQLVGEDEQGERQLVSRAPGGGEIHDHLIAAHRLH